MISGPKSYRDFQGTGSWGLRTIGRSSRGLTISDLTSRGLAVRGLTSRIQESYDQGSYIKGSFENTSSGLTFRKDSPVQWSLHLEFVMFRDCYVQGFLRSGVLISRDL